MNTADFVPIVYFRENCPFCLKARMFLLESGAIDDVEIREFTPGTSQEYEIREELADKLDQVTFPAAQMEPGRFIKGSDEIIDVISHVVGIDQQRLPGLSAYRQLMKYVERLRSENEALKAEPA